jgi:ubiquinone/menaquinone biosynthesis C-methylase UbiE
LVQPLLPSTAFADAWTKVDQTEDPRFFVNLLDATRARLLERARMSPKEFFAPLGLCPGLNVLDVGCGTGDFLRLLAPIVAPGKAVGLDLSETMIAEAVQRSAENRENLSFRLGSALELPFPAGSFDRILATQVLLHIPDPWTALAEMKRVLAPTGLICVTEIDWGTLVVHASDKELGRRFSDLACRELRNGLIIRDLPGQLRGLGFNHIIIRPEVEVAENLDAFYTWFVEPSLRHFKRIGAFSEAEVDAFLADLKERAQHGRYFSSRTFYTVLASQLS